MTNDTNKNIKLKAIRDIRAHSRIGVENEEQKTYSDDLIDQDLDSDTEVALDDLPV